MQQNNVVSKMKHCFKKERLIYSETLGSLMPESDLLKSLIDDKIVRVMKLFTNNSDKEFYLREIAKQTKVSPASTHRILKKLTKKNIVIKRKRKHLITYTINNDETDLIFDVFEDRKNALESFKNDVKDLKGVKKIVLTGKSSKNKASVLIVGEVYEKDFINKKTMEIKEKYNFKIIHLIVSSEQYEQMDMMDLYSGKSEVLYKEK